MPDFFQDNPDLLFRLDSMDLAEIVRFAEDDFADADAYPDAPADLEDALDNYRRVLELVGEIAGEFVAPLAEDVDREGATFEAGEVAYAPGTAAALEMLRQADLMGMTLPRKYGGLNIPKTIYCMAIEMVSRADASLMNIFGLQEISETIYHFGSDEQRKRYLPRFCSGELTGAMALTEPEAGSDLPAIKCKAVESSEGGKWLLSGTKHFITNGCAGVLLVMARSEPDVEDARGLSLFIYERDDRMSIRRIEDKHGIHGSPTCELQFNEAEAELLGERRWGLIKYTMALMNGARLAVAAQAVGIAEAAYREASDYAAVRVQFGRPIRDFAPICEMLISMKVNIEGARALLYETACIVDLRERMQQLIARHPEMKKELRKRVKHASDYELVFTAILKCFATETGNRVCYDALQVHGGAGYMRDFAIERHCRDMRVTNIYEGTTQMQVEAAIGGVMRGVISRRLDEYENAHDFSAIPGLHQSAEELRQWLESALSAVTAREDPDFQAFHARRLVDMAADTLIGHLLCIDALKSERKKRVARVFLVQAAGRTKPALDYILSGDRSCIEYRDEILQGDR